MSYPVYYVPAGDTLPIMFHTFDGGTGASITLTGLVAGDIEIYKDGSITQRASDAGYTLLDTDGIDFDGITGIHGFSIDTGDNTDAGFYTVGSWFTVVVSAVTVDAQTVNFIAAQFRIMAAEGVAGVPDVNTTHVSDTAQTANDNGADINAILVDTNELQTDWVNGGRLDLILDARASQASVDTIDGIVDSILLDTAEIGAAGAGLTAINLPDQTMNITGNITGNLSGSVGSVTGSVGSLAAQAKADVNAEVVDALNTDTYAEPGQGAPAATTTLVAKIGYLYKFLRNKIETTSTQISVYDDAGTTVDQKSTISDDGSTFTRGEFGSGP